MRFVCGFEERNAISEAIEPCFIFDVLEITFTLTKENWIHKYLLKQMHFEFLYVIKNYAHIQICCVK